MLKIKNFKTNSEESNLDQAFLFDIMELNERAADLKNVDEVKAFDNEVINFIKSKTEELRNGFKRNALDEVLQTANKLRFYKNLHETIREIKLKFGIQD